MTKNKTIIVITDKEEAKGYFGITKTKFGFKTAIKNKESVIATTTLANIPIDRLHYLGYDVIKKFNGEFANVEAYIEPKPDIFDKIIDAIFFRNL